MNMKKGQRVIIFSITIICLIGLLYTFKSFRFSTSQETSKLTGFPIWYEIEKSEASIAWFGYLIIIIFCSTLASLIFTHNKSIPKVYISYFIFPDHPDYNHSSTLSTKFFNKILAYFSLFTFISDLALQILYPGKLWSSFDSFHINLLTITLKWPLDAIWFKMQDLMLDFALVIIFLRIYIRTYLYIKNQDSSQFPEGNDPQEEFNSNTKFSKFTNQIILLPIAAFVHMFGTIATLFVHPTG
ncbi:17333_t:CDS:2 [Rhizophagus irregularis]|nr:17333_t:CDS:2 [Rhizophagus irregularis]